MIQETTEDLKVFNTVLEPDFLAEVESKAMVVNVNAGEVALHIGKPVWGIPLIVKGIFKATRVNDEGQEILLYYLKSGETCAMSFTCWMTNQVSPIRSTAEEDSMLYVIPGQLADEWMIRFPCWRKFVMSTVLDGFTEIVRSIDDIAFKKMDDRIVTYLKQKSAISGSSLVNLTHQQIADELGTNRVVVSRLLKKLEIDGRLLLYRNQIKLLRQL